MSTTVVLTTPGPHVILAWQAEPKNKSRVSSLVKEGLERVNSE